MKFFKCTVLIGCFLAVTNFAVAQKPKPVIKPAAVQKYNPPKLKTSLGNLSDSVLTVSVDEAVDLIHKPLVITDNKKISYTISSYQCMYKKRGVTEDEETGKVSPATSITVQRFTTSPVSELWRRIISEQLKNGEEIYFFDIVVKDSQNRLIFAPNIKLLIK